MTGQELLTPTEIVRSKRRSIALVISINGDLIVRAPIFASAKDIEKFINAKSNWIVNKRIAILEDHKHKQLDIKDGEELTILGTKYVIKVKDITRIQVFDGVIYVPCENSKEKLISFVKRELKKFMTTRVAEIAYTGGFTYDKIRINSAHTCWGSCSGKNSLNFTFKLAFCPMEVIDYIIIHELCHTVHKNHSKSFWNLVSKICPNFMKHEKWLKGNSKVINII